MTDGGNALFLHGGGGGKKCPGRTEQDPLPAAGLESLQQISGKDPGGAAAARGAAVNVLSFSVKEKQATVYVAAKFHAILFEPLFQNTAAQFPQIAGDDQVVVFWGAPGVLEVSGNGVIGGGGRCQGYTINSLKKLVFGSEKGWNF